MDLADKNLPEDPDLLAPDGSEVRLLFEGRLGGMAHFTLPAGAVAKAVRHQTVEEIWLVLSGRGRVWRRLNGADSTIDLEPGVALTIPLGTEFQFSASAEADLSVVIATMPPWPGEDEAIIVEGPWKHRPIDDRK